MPAPLRLSPAQLGLVERPLDARLFLEGPAGCGKTTAGVERLLHLMARGVPGGSILLIAPQRTLLQPYLEALNTPGVVAGGVVTALTVGGLARRMVELFWPLVAAEAGFARPDEPPLFLTLETAQYTMARLVRPLLDEGFFSSVTIDRNRLYSQVIDNLNKAAAVGFPYSEIGVRLKQAWSGEPGQLRVYDDTQACAERFREHCLAHNLLDFSLQLEVFLKHLWPAGLCRQYLLENYRHLLVENLEEDIPAAHDLLRFWLPHCDSALLIYDQQAGYRRFLGADPLSAYALAELCQERIVFYDSFVASASIQSLEQHLSSTLRPSSAIKREKSAQPASALEPGTLLFQHHRYLPEMLDWVAAEIARLVESGEVTPGEIAVLAPFLSDALRYSLSSRLEALNVPVRSHRPSRALREEPATHCLLTLSALAHPDWGLRPAKFDVAYALLQAIDGLDLVRAQLLAEIVYRTRDGQPILSSFERIVPETQERITFRLGQRYEALRLWLAAYSQARPEEFDHFLSRLFGELLSQPGFGFHASYTAGEITANLIESVQKFRWAVGQTLVETSQPLGKEYLLMVQDGVIAAQYIRSWQPQEAQAVLLAPAYTFLMSNRPVQVQFWLDVGSRGWAERLYQPLTHPYVLSRQWPSDRPWTDLDEVETSQAALQNLVSGLLRRCRGRVYLGLSELGEQGYEQRGPLLRAFQRLLRDQVSSG